MKAGDKSDAMSDKMKALYEKEKTNIITLMGWSDQEDKKDMFEHLIVKNFTFVVPAGKSFSYKATMRARTDYTVPEGETFSYITPFVYVGSKRISGNSQDNSLFTERLGLKAQGSAETEYLTEFLEMFDGDVIAEDTRTMN